MSGASDIPLSPFNRNKIGDKRVSNLIITRAAGTPLALHEDDALLPPEKPASGPEIDDLSPGSRNSGGSEVEDMLPPRRFNPKTNDFPGVDDGLIPRRDNHFPIPEDYPTPQGPGVVKLPDVNVYQQKKTLAQGMMDLALLTANANQLRYVLDAGSNHSYYYVNLSFIVISIALQVCVGVLLLWNSRFNINKEQHIIRANRINNFTLIGIFLITILNVFISAFGLPDRSLMMASQVESQDVETITTELDLITESN